MKKTIFLTLNILLSLFLFLGCSKTSVLKEKIKYVNHSENGVIFSLPKDWSSKHENESSNYYYYPISENVNDVLLLQITDIGGNLNEIDNTLIVNSLMEGVKSGLTNYKEISRSYDKNKNNIVVNQIIFTAVTSASTDELTFNLFLVYKNNYLYNFMFEQQNSSNKDYSPIINHLKDSIKFDEKFFK